MPAGWWHAVLNMDATVAITGNVLMPSALHTVWPAMAWPPVQLHSFARECAARWPELWEGDNVDLLRVLSRAPLQTANGVLALAPVFASGECWAASCVAPVHSLRCDSSAVARWAQRTTLLKVQLGIWMYTLADTDERDRLLN